MRLKSKLAFNRYAKLASKKSRKYTGILRIISLMYWGGYYFFKHPNIWDYLNTIEKNDYCIKLRDSAILYVPWCRNDLIQ